MTRQKTPQDVITQVLVESRRRCALCFGLERKTIVSRGQIAHIDRNNANSAATNLAWLCLDHHDQYDSRTSQSKGMTPQELRLYRDELHKFIQQARRALEPVAKYLELSAEASLVAEVMNRGSTNGMKFDPQHHMAGLAALVDLSETDLEIAIDELVSSGVLAWNGSHDFVFAQNRLFWETDPLFSDNDPTTDTIELAQYLVSTQREVVDMQSAAESLGWHPRRLNPAITLLAENGHVGKMMTMGSAPFAFYVVQVTTSTKRYVRDSLRAQSSSA